MRHGCIQEAASYKWARTSSATSINAMVQLCPQLFVLFDLKKNNVVDFSEFVRALSVFHPKAPLEEKAECERSCCACLLAESIRRVDRSEDLKRGQTHHIITWQ